ETGRYDPILPPRESRRRKAIESRRRPTTRADKQEEGCSRPAFARRCSTGLVFEWRGIIPASNYNPARNILRKMVESRNVQSSRLIVTVHGRRLYAIRINPFSSRAMARHLAGFLFATKVRKGVLRDR